MVRVQLTLTKAAYADEATLANSIELLRQAGAFSSLESKYASRLGVLSGELPEQNVAAVEALDVVSALQRDEPVSLR
jgi:hypothetical protein